MALVGARNGQTGVFAGMQCDANDPHAHRLIFGALRNAQTGRLDALLHQSNKKLLVITNAQSLSTQFRILSDDRNQKNSGVAVDYTTANLDQSQFDALNNARGFVMGIGALQYSFSGAGSSRAIGSMACQGTGRHIASRLIEARREGAPSQILGNWALVYHSGSAALVKGRAEAYVSTTSPSFEPSASFRIGVSCLDRQLYAHLDVGIAPRGADDTKLTKTSAFIHDFVHHEKVVEMYRSGQRVTTLLIDNNEMSGLGHALSRYEMASLMESDDLVVVSHNQSVEFSMVNSVGSLEVLRRICSTPS